MSTFKTVTANHEHAIARVSVLGIGLVGGSIALAAKRAGCVVKVYDTSAATGEAARAEGLITVDTPAALCEDADVLFIAVPVDQVRAVAPMIRGYLEPGCIVTDVSSVKRPVQGLPGLLGEARVSTILGHPMAGSHTSGFESARADLFEGCTWLLCDAEEVPEADRLAALLLRFGVGRVLDCPTHTHDTLVAAISHLPQLAASALAATVGEAVETLANGALEIAGGGFRDSTRIAESPYAVWRPILEENRSVLAMLLEELAERLNDAAKALENWDDAHLETLFAGGNACRELWRRAQPSGPTLDSGDEQSTSETPLWVDPVSGNTAWLDRSFAWETVRTSAPHPDEHALVSARYIAVLLGIDSGHVKVLCPGSTHGEAVSMTLNAAGASVQARTTWTADGLHVEGVDLPGGRFVVVT